MDSVIRLEKAYAKFIGSKYAVACNSGTSALHLALLALGIGQGDEVIVPDFTMAACGFAVAYTGAKPVFVDCGEDLNIDPQYIEEKITSKTKAIMVVHIYGRLCNMREINRIANKYKLPIIEDACEAQGANLGPATLTCHSFYRNKIVHAEEGGMVTTNDKGLAEDIRDLKNMAFGKAHDYFHKRIGFNYRMPNSQAQMALRSLKNVKANLKRRREIEAIFKRELGDTMPQRDVVWVYDMEGKKPNNEHTRHLFKPLSSMPMFPESDSLVAYAKSQGGFYINVNPEWTDSQVLKICRDIQHVII